MKQKLLHTKENITNPNSGDISNYIENKSNKIWYVIDAVSSCNNPRTAAIYTNEIIQKFCTNHTIENRFDIGALLKEIHDSLKTQDLKLSVCFSAVFEMPNGSFEVVNVGDCRVYELQKSTILRVTRDDSIVQELIDKNEITEEQAHVHAQKSFVTQTLGASEILKMNFYSLNKNASGFLLTSDGIHGELMDHQIEHILFNENLSITDAYSTILERSKVIEGLQDDQSLIMVKKENSISNLELDE